MTLEEILLGFKDGNISLEKVMEYLKDLPYADLGAVKFDHHRELRKGFGETVFCQGKCNDDLIELTRHLKGRKSNAFFTRVSEEQAKCLLAEEPRFKYDKTSRTLFLEIQSVKKNSSSVIPILSAGTSDIPVASEAAVTCEVMGHEVKRIFDVGVAGIHRLFAYKSDLEQARVIIAVAGMEGALPSVVAGLSSAPVIAVPTSIGYGAGLGGYAAMLTMLNSCAPGIAVVNIDNGFGAGYLASQINTVPSRE